MYPGFTRIILDGGLINFAWTRAHTQGNLKVRSPGLVSTSPDKIRRKKNQGRIEGDELRLMVKLFLKFGADFVGKCTGGVSKRLTLENEKRA